MAHTDKTRETTSEATTRSVGVQRLVMRFIEWLHKRLFFTNWAAQRIEQIGEDRLIAYLEHSGFKKHVLADGAVRYYDPKDPSKHWTFRIIGLNA